jgi:hypothetical protein
VVIRLANHKRIHAIMLIVLEWRDLMGGVRVVVVLVVFNQVNVGKQ